MADIDVLIEETIDAWDRAEIVIKKCDHANIDSYIPAINELRYAGRNLISAWKEFRHGNHDEVENYCAVVRHSARCAQHDATDGLLLHVKIRLQEAQARFGEKRLAAKFPDVEHLTKLLLYVDPDVEETRGNHLVRPEKYASIENGVLDEVISYSRALDSAVFDLSAEDNQLERMLGDQKRELALKDIKIQQASLLNFFLTIVSILTAIISVVAIFK